VVSREWSVAVDEAQYPDIDMELKRAFRDYGSRQTMQP
jgi:hypothetical protein